MLGALLGTRRTREPQERLSYGDGNAWWWPFERPTASSGQTVTADSAMRVAAVLACVRVLSETLASAPCIFYRRAPDGGKDRASSRPLYGVLHDSPNQWQTAFEFWEMAMGHLALRGNFYSQIVPGSLGAVTELIPLNPDRMKVDRLPNGRLRYTFTDLNGAKTIYAQDEIFHIRGLSSDGLVGLSIIAMQRDTVGISMAQSKYIATFYKNDAQPGVVLQTEQPLKDDARVQLRDMWDQRHGGADNRSRTAVLSHGLKAERLGMTNDDAQVIEQMRLSNEDIARIFRVPPHLIQDLSRSTNNNIEQQSLEFVMYTMLPWFRRIEAAISRDLVTDPNCFAEFLVDGLLRGDQKSRYEAYNIARNGGWMNGDEIRAKENMNSMGPEGKIYLVQGAMIPIEAAAGQVKPPPPSPPPAKEPPTLSEITNGIVPTISEKIDSELSKVIESGKSDVAVERQKADELRSKLEEERIAKERESLLREQAERLSESVKTDAEKYLSDCQSAIAARQAAELDAAQSKAQIEAAGLRERAAVEKLSGAVAAMRSLAAETMRRTIRHEIENIRKLANRKNFLKEIDGFYRNQEKYIDGLMSPPLEQLARLGAVEIDSEQLARNHCDQSVEQLLEVAGRCTAEELEPELEALLAGWEQRAGFLEK